MQIGFVGLGRMGGNMARRLARGGMTVVGFDHNTDARSALARDGITVVDSLAKLIGALVSPRIVWLMVPAGAITEATIAALTPLLAAGDVLVDGGNAFYKDSQRRGAEL